MGTPPVQQSTQIGLFDIWSMQRELEKSVHAIDVNIAGMSGRFDGVQAFMTESSADRAAIRTQLAQLRTELDTAQIHPWKQDIEARVRRNERWRWSIPPALVTAITSLIIVLIHQFG